MVETLVLAVGFFCGNAPLRTMEVTSAVGVLSPLAVPKACPQPKEPLFLELTCAQKVCTGQITQGTEAGHAHAALANIDGPPNALRIRFTNEEGLLLSRLRLSVVDRRPLTSADERELAPVLAHGTVARVTFGDGGALFSGSASGDLGTVGPRAEQLTVRLRVQDERRTVEILSSQGAVLLGADEGSRASVPCARVGVRCKGKTLDGSEPVMTLSVEVDPEGPPATPAPKSAASGQ